MGLQGWDESEEEGDKFEDPKIQFLQNQNKNSIVYYQWTPKGREKDIPKALNMGLQDLVVTEERWESFKHTTMVLKFLAAATEREEQLVLLFEMKNDLKVCVLGG